MITFFKTLSSGLKNNPHIFNAFTSFCLFTGSDAIAQFLEADKNNGGFDSLDILGSIDKQRVLSAGIIGVFFGVGVYPTAYARLDKLLPGRRFTTVFQKSILEIATVGIFVNSISMLSRGILNGKDRIDVMNHVYYEMPDVTLNDARVWLPYNVIAFTFIPVYIRPTTTALMESAWQTYISLRSNDYDTDTTALSVHLQ